MPNLYHGSVPRYLAGRLVSWLRWPKRAIKRRFFEPTRVESNSVAMRHLAQANEHINRLENDAALRHALDAASIPGVSADHRLVRNLARTLRYLGARDHACRLIAERELLLNGGELEYWRGHDISDRRLLIEWDNSRLRGDVGTGLRCLSYVAHAAKRAKSTIVMVEPRLVPLYRRTLKNVEVRSATDDNPRAANVADVRATFGMLEALFGPGPGATADFVPLRPDEALVAKLREGYRRAGGLPLIGISWGSKVRGKEFPGLLDWAEFMQSSSAVFVSLQYGNVTTALRKLRTASSTRILDDPTVDQLLDMDRFAAQVAALDAVISVNNTIAHTAGALDVPLVVILGDRLRRNWVLRESPNGEFRPGVIYPKAVIVRRNARHWKQVLEEAQSHLSFSYSNSSGAITRQS
jgi:hypothetical protein